MLLHLGVIDVPYATGGKTTGDVAEILEKKYGIMKVYADTHMPFIAESLEDSLAGQLESLLMGATPRGDPFLKGTGAIDQSFKAWLDANGPAVAGVPGAPTKAAQAGVNTRFKSKKQKVERMSFIDTGAYQGHFKSWVD